MSKRSLFWGQAAGKLGEAVYYRAGGEQRTRAYVKTVKNPKTREQMIQRIKMANIVSMFRSAKPILSKSFPSKKSNQSDFNKFAALNVSRVQALNNKYTYQEGYCFPQNMIVSDGDISIDTTVTNRKWQNSGDESSTEQYWATVPGVVIEKFEPVSVSGIVTLETGSDVYKYLVGKTNPNNLPAEFVVVVFNGVFADEGWWLCYQRIKASATSIEKWQQYNPYDVRPWQINVQVCESTVSESGAVSADPAGDSFLSLNVGETAEDLGEEDVYGIMFAWTENGKQRVTRSVIQANSDSTMLLDWLPGGELYERAISDWGTTEGSIISTK